MGEDLPNKFDLVVIGTGFAESCIAAAASRIGKTVLHIDENEFYGGTWSSFSLETFHQLLQRHTTNEGSEIRNALCRWHAENFENAPQETETQAVNQEQLDLSSDHIEAAPKIPPWNQEELLKNSRRFNIDLCPKILYSSGKLVQLLISSNICRYAEFRAVDHVCARFRDTLINVPCSRSDVFNTKDLNVIEKRLLMKFLSTCLAYGEGKLDDDAFDFRNKTFHEYLKAQNLTEKISSCVMQAIAMCSINTPFEQGMANTKKFLESLGRYGNTPFIFPMYGCGEIPQCFCRLCAVFGGTYCLNQKISGIQENFEEQNVTLMMNDKAITAGNMVVSHGAAPAHALGNVQNRLSRGVFIASSPLGGEDLNKAVTGGVNLMRMLSEDTHEAILLQLSYFSGACPKDIYLFHLTTLALSDNPEQDLEPFTRQVFHGENAPKLLYSAYFSLTANCSRTSAVSAGEENAIRRIHCTAGPFYELDYDESIADARNIFAKIYPEAEFLPRAPDPEEIVIDGEDPRALNEVSLPDDLREQLRELEKSADNMDIEESQAQGDGQMNEPKELNTDAAFDSTMETVDT